LNRLPAFRDDNLRTYIPTDVDRRYRTALLAGARAAGSKTYRLMAEALTNGPSKGGATEAQKHFGDDLPLILAGCNDLIRLLNNGMPGFSEWLEATGFGNDKAMILAMASYAEAAEIELTSSRRSVRQVLLDS
jgi:hypothetical protein